MKIFKDSFRNFKSLTCLIVTALFIALNLVLDNFQIIVSPTLKIGVGFITSPMIGMLFGPSVALFAGGMTDVLSWLFKPSGAYFPGFTVTAMFAGLVYGLFFYKREKISLLRSFFAKAIVNVAGNIGLNTLWLSMITGKGVLALLPARAVTNLTLLPFQAIVVFALAAAVQRVVAASRIDLYRVTPTAPDEGGFAARAGLLSAFVCAVLAAFVSWAVTLGDSSVAVDIDNLAVALSLTCAACVLIAALIGLTAAKRARKKGYVFEQGKLMAHLPGNALLLSLTLYALFTAVCFLLFWGVFAAMKVTELTVGGYAAFEILVAAAAGGVSAFVLAAKRGGENA